MLVRASRGSVTTKSSRAECQEDTHLRFGAQAGLDWRGREWGYSAAESSSDHASHERGTVGLTTDLIYRRPSGRNADAFHPFRERPHISFSFTHPSSGPLESR